MEKVHLQIEALEAPLPLLKKIENALGSEKFTDLISERSSWNDDTNKLLRLKVPNTEDCYDKVIDDVKSDYPSYKFSYLSNAIKEKNGKELETKLKDSEKLIDLLLEKIPSECTVEGIKKLIDCLVENYDEYIPKEMAPWLDSIHHYRDDVIGYICSSHSDLVLKSVDGDSLLRQMIDNYGLEEVLHRVKKEILPPSVDFDALIVSYRDDGFNKVAFSEDLKSVDDTNLLDMLYIMTKEIESRKILNS